MQAVVVSRIADVERADWNALNSSECPFLSHEFLNALEQSGSVCADTGWEPCHILVHADDGALIAAMPTYNKHHSYGEYVFDWSWADAYHRAGRQYYPKLLSAIPYSPVTSPRLLISDHAVDIAELFITVKDKIVRFANSSGASSWHVLFPDEYQKRLFTAQGMLARMDCQYHWFNNGYRDFEDFLSTFTSRKRKSVRKERQRVVEQGIELQTLSGTDIRTSHWDTFYRFYHMTYLKRGGSGYLNRAFFASIAEHLSDKLVMVCAYREDRAVGAALCLQDDRTLYGRYWGCLEEYEFLHFEACYYRGIEYCIEQGLQRFDPGAQGQHKIQRGFIPVFTYSCHWLAEEDFSAAIEQFLDREREHIEEYRHAACERLPFNQQTANNTIWQNIVETGLSG